MPSSSTAAVRDFDHKATEEKPTTPPLPPTRAAERPAIPVKSDPGYCIRRFVEPPKPSDRPPLFAGVTPSPSPGSAEAIGQARMQGTLAGILSPLLD
ncbi:hypothetical protein CGRA01v4_01917 [Colletotrichum graminicola]|nr:hypothetical protein CGRA01v4_01917 [Colletotrichum graminicola]